MGLLEAITHKEEIERLLKEAKLVYKEAEEKLEEQKKKTAKQLKVLGTVKVNAWAQDMNMFLNAYRAFQQFDVNQSAVSVSRYSQANEEPEKVLINMQKATFTASDVAKIGVAAVGTGTLVGIASYGGAMMFGHSSTGKAITELHGAAKKNATLAWFGNGSKATGGLGMDGGKLVLAGIVVAPIAAVAAVLTGKKGKQKLEEAQKVHAEALDAVSKMEAIRETLVEIGRISEGYVKAIKKIRKPFRQYTKELIKIRTKYTQRGCAMVDCAELPAFEQTTVMIAWQFAQLYHRLLSTPLMDETGGVVCDAEQMLLLSLAEHKQIEKDTFYMKGEEAKAGDVLWKGKAIKYLILNFTFVAIFLGMCVITLTHQFLVSLVFFVGAIIGFPIFFYFKNMSQSKLYVWRKARLIGAIVFVLGMCIWLMR